MLHDLAETRRVLETQGIDVVRLIFTDLLGITRSKDLLVSQLERSAAHGPAFCQGTWVTTTRGGVLDAGTGSFGDGLPDMVASLDTDTIRPIPWLPGVAYAIADIDNPDGSRSDVAPRAVLRSVLDEYDKLGLVPVCGPELEFYFAQRTADGWERILNKTGRVYTTGAHVDPDGHYLHLLRMLDQLNIGAFAGNHEFCPSQYEINLWHSEAMDAADRTFLFKTAIKDVTAMRGILGTFLGKPWNDEGGSGFHLHFSVTDSEGVNLMHDGAGELSGDGPADDRRGHRARRRDRRLHQPHRQRVQAPRARHPGAVPVELGLRQPVDDDPHPPGARAGHAPRAAHRRRLGEPVRRDRGRAGGCPGRHPTRAHAPAAPPRDGRTRTRRGRCCR